MSTIDKILDKLETPEGQEEMEKALKEFIAEEKIKEEKTKKIMSDVTYINWLIQFTEDKGYFCTTDWDYCPEKITPLDNQNIESFPLFYNGIEQYAKKYGIHREPLKYDYGYYYQIRLGDIGFTINIIFGQGTHYTCERITVFSKNDFININDVILDKAPPKEIENDITLSSLSNMIKTLHENGISIDLILSTVYKTIEKIITKKEHNSKKVKVKAMRRKKHESN